MKLTRKVSFNVENDLQTISAMIDGKVASMAEHKVPGKDNFVRMYLVAPDGSPMAIFDAVPYDLYLKIVLGRDISFNDETRPFLVNVCAFEKAGCICLQPISVPSVIFVTLLLAEYRVSDLSFFHNYALDKLGRIISKKEGHQ